MSYLFVSEQGASIGIRGGRIEIKCKDEMLRSIPFETLETIQIFGHVNVTTQCLTACLEKGIILNYYSTTGRYYGRLVSPCHVNVERQRMQALIGEDREFCLAVSKSIVRAKVQNQKVILRRYARRQDTKVSEAIQDMSNMQKHIVDCENIPQLMGYEGAAARTYFKALGRLINPEFAFDKRSRRPPRDEFNSMISLGYSILLNEIVGKLEGRGLNPYFGIMHSDREKHPTLASDLMEEWRAVIVDSTTMSLVNGHEIKKNEFDRDENGVYLSNTAFKTFVRKLDNKLRTDSRYIETEEFSTDFRHSLDHQITSLVKAMEEKKADIYQPVVII